MSILHILFALAGISVAVLAADCKDPKATALCGTACCVPGMHMCGTDDKGADVCIQAIPSFTAGPHSNPPNATTTEGTSGTVTGSTWISINSTTAIVIPTSAIVVNGTTVFPSSNSTKTITSTISSVDATTTVEGSATFSESTTDMETETGSQVSTKTASSGVPSSTGGAVASMIPAGAVGVVFAAVLGAL